jgi:hypothetical protein
MERANGTDRYCNTCDENFNPRTGSVSGSGLGAIQTVELFRAVLNERYSWYNLSGNTAETLLRQVTENSPRYYVPVALEWTRYQNKEVTPRHRHITLDERNASHAISDHHVRVPGTDTKEAGRIGSHFCLVLRVENGRVYIRNMHGPTTIENGTELANPPRRVEDNSAGIESMKIDEFKARVHRVYVLDAQSQR